jgi:hypothetical protein
MKKKMTKLEEDFLTSMAFAIQEYYSKTLSEKMKRVWQKRKRVQKLSTH